MFPLLTSFVLASLSVATSVGVVVAEQTGNDYLAPGGTLAGAALLSIIARQVMKAWSNQQTVNQAIITSQNQIIDGLREQVVSERARAREAVDQLMVERDRADLRIRDLERRVAAAGG